ncbi:MAG: hypothetical protein HZA53_00240 [Planctomycetes bacterium]|nr:hypothetical protein [Planctomycetota bacterium]
MESLRWGTSMACLALGGWIAVMNAVIAVRWTLGRLPEGRSVSMVPILGNALLLVGTLLLPVEGASRWWWAAFVLDVSSAQLLALPFFLTRRWWNGRHRGQ